VVPEGEEVWVIGGLGGRFDHTIQNINLMYKYADKIKIRMVDQHSLITTILPGNLYKVK
jgi:thiamine pyrophosphokinase